MTRTNRTIETLHRRQRWLVVGVLALGAGYIGWVCYQALALALQHGYQGFMP